MFVVVVVVFIVVDAPNSANFESGGHCHGLKYLQFEIDSCK